MTFEERLIQKAQAVDETILRFLPEAKGYPATVIEAMHYALTGGGKRIRPVLMRESFTMAGGTDEELIAPFESAIEMIHTYSLVHDDLPAMDDDALRRGRATTHVVYGEGMGVLTGDALLNYAYETALCAFDAVPVLAERKGVDVSVLYARIARALRVLAEKAGIRGMVGGQCADLVGERRDREGKIAEENLTLSGKGSEEELQYIHEHKTSALLEAAMMCGAVLGGAKESEVSYLEEAARLTGYAFQIRDDILDATGDAVTLGKETGQDEKNLKTTYVTLHGINAAEAEVARLSEEAVKKIQLFEACTCCGEGTASFASALFIRELILWLTARDH